MDEAPDNREAGDAGHPDIPAEAREKLVSLMQKMMEMGICAVYGQEDEGAPAAHVDCASNLKWCRAICCTFQFALTKEEVRKGHLKHNPSRPFFASREPDGYCTHLDRGDLRCSVWSERPSRCRKYDCTEDPQVPKQL